MAGIPSHPSSGGNSFQESIRKTAASEQLNALLSTLPPDLYFMKRIKDAAERMTPAGLNKFVFALRKEIENIMKEDANNFSTKVGIIMGRVLKNTTGGLKSGEISRVGNTNYASNDKEFFQEAA